ncbi:hypothetical protein FF38_04983 [Lucilia cuprina]|uniref:F-box domain-containing protein n=1 Tax=Lucilia cuprina TaxID=7375 RepID=A0A0L0CJP7_LUCCU|nr:F-box/LRR-repeat protein 12 [Lucilia cuprina]KNC32427.1 hypothetical protein FF38_04983 [Lucilia cuprina]
MDNLTTDNVNDDSICNPETSNKRKRHYSSTQIESSDESPKKKIATTTSASHIDNVNATYIKNGGGGAEDDHPQHETINIGNGEESQFFLEELCDEVLYEIFKFLDTWSLMALMNVCKRFQKFVLDKRLWENIDLSQEPLPLGILEDMLERSHDKTKSIKLRGPSPSQHIEGEIQHFNKTILNSLTTRCTKLVILELYGVTLDFNQIALKDFPQTLKRLVLNTCNVRVVSNKSLFTGIDTILVNLEELAIENNSWFDPYYVMPLSKLPVLRYLSLKGCWLMQEFIPYGSIAARHGFKQLEVLDLRDTPLNDSDLQCFNTIETLKEIYLQCPEEEEDSISMQAVSSSGTQSEMSNNQESNSSTNFDILSEMPSTSSTSSENANCSLNSETPSTSRSLTDTERSEDISEKTDDSLNTSASLYFTDSESASSSSSSSSASPKSNSVAENNAAATSSAPSTLSQGLSLSPNIVPLVGTNVPTRSRFLPRPDHIFYLNVRNRISIDCSHINVRDQNIVRPLRRPRPPQQQQQNQQQQSPPPVIEQLMRHNMFWDIVNPLGRVVGVGGPDRLFGEENGAEYHLNLFSLSSSYRQQSRGTISDRGVCCFGRTRQPVQQGVIWIRFNNRPYENRFERFSVRDYKSVTDVSLQHLVQCSPHLIFLDVSGTSVTLEGLQRFKELKPECKVVAEHLLGMTKTEATVT